MSHQNFLGKSKSVIMANFHDSIEFLHWLYLPTLGIILSFEKQVCCGMAVMK